MEIVADMRALALKASESIQGRTIAVSGGSTFAAVFPNWVEPVRRRLASGESLRFLPVDERGVGYDEPGCNWKVCVDRLLEPAGLGEQKSHHVTTVETFQALLQREWKGKEHLDTVFLGMGQDGHTASLFPNTEALDNSQSWVLETQSPIPPLKRLTLGLRALWEAERLVALVSGEDKAEMVKRLVNGDKSLPIALALQGHKEPWLIVDEGAATKL